MWGQPKSLPKLWRYGTLWRLTNAVDAFFASGRGRCTYNLNTPPPKKKEKKSVLALGCTCTHCTSGYAYE